MTDDHVAEGNPLADDVELAWSYAINADLVHDPGPRASPAARQHAQDLRDARHRLYARYLLEDLECDRERIAGIARECRARADADTRLGGYVTAAVLAEYAMAMIREVEAAYGTQGQQRLLAELRGEYIGPAEREAPDHQHRLLNRLLRRGNPAWWQRRLRARLDVTMVCRDYDYTRFQELVILAGGQEIGHVVFGSCATCKQVSVHRKDVG